MSFFTLLILLSLIIIVPIFFVMKEKSRRLQIDSTHRHKQYLASASSALSKNEQALPQSDKTDGLAIIKFTAQHPFIKYLYAEQVPEAFRAIMDDIGQQYERTHHAQITESQLFILNKLIEIRIPELIDDYLSLDPYYARTVVIDREKSATSYSIVLEQLNSILDFGQKLNTQSQSGVVDKLLASRRYLDDVYQESAVSNDLLKLK